MIPVAILFARRDSIYKTIPGCDVFDQDRDARTFQGGMPVVAHPPCGPWGKLRTFAHRQRDQRELGPWAVAQVRAFGGVLEHPAYSTLFDHCSMPQPNEFRDAYGGWTLGIDQYHFGHRARKSTWLYIVGTETVPWLPSRPGRPTHVINHCIRGEDGKLIRKGHPAWRPECNKPEREHTPPALAQWLVELARRCTPTPPQPARQALAEGRVR